MSFDGRSNALNTLEHARNAESSKTAVEGRADAAIYALIYIGDQLGYIVRELRYQSEQQGL